MKRPKKMKYKHNFPVRQKNPITGEITMQNHPHSVLIPTEAVTLLVHEDAVKRSKEMHGRGNSQLCSGSLCVWAQRNCFSHRVTGTADFLYSRVFIQSDAQKRECYGYAHDDDWFPKLNDQKGGHDKILAMIRENRGPLTLKLRPIQADKTHQRTGILSGVAPRRSPKKRGSHLRAVVGEYGIDSAYHNKD